MPYLTIREIDRQTHNDMLPITTREYLSYKIYADSVKLSSSKSKIPEDLLKILEAAKSAKMSGIKACYLLVCNGFFRLLVEKYGHCSFAQPDNDNNV